MCGGRNHGNRRRSATDANSNRQLARRLLQYSSQKALAPVVFAESGFTVPLGRSVVVQFYSAVSESEKSPFFIFKYSQVQETKAQRRALSPRYDIILSLCDIIVDSPLTSLSSRGCPFSFSLCSVFRVYVGSVTVATSQLSSWRSVVSAWWAWSPWSWQFLWRCCGGAALCHCPLSVHRGRHHCSASSRRGS